MTAPLRRLLGLTSVNQPLFEPRPGHSLCLSAAGGGKTTCAAIPWVLSLLMDPSRAIIVNDAKDGEIAAQLMDLCARFGRKVALIDDADVLGAANPHKVRLNPLGSVVQAFTGATGEMVFATENANHAIIEEPSNDEKNRYWREEPRSFLEFAMHTLLRRNPELATPGSVWSLVANPELLTKAAQIEAEEGDEVLAALGAHILDMAEKNAEHFAQHRGGAVKAMRLYSAGSPLHQAGFEPTTTHAALIREKYIIFLVGPQRHMARLGTHYALHLQAFMDALLAGAGDADFILDEFTNAPLKALVSGLTTMRGYGGRCHMIAQSRSEIQRRYGEKETATIEENALVKQWFGFSSFEEAERISQAIGETQTLTQGLGTNSGQVEISGNLGEGRERLISADTLLRMRADQQLLHVKSVGFMLAGKLRQNEIAPFCHHIADNPLEGARLPPDPKITLDVSGWEG